MAGEGLREMLAQERESEDVFGPYGEFVASSFEPPRPAPEPLRIEPADWHEEQRQREEQERQERERAARDRTIAEAAELEAAEPPARPTLPARKRKWRL